MGVPLPILEEEPQLLLNCVFLREELTPRGVAPVFNPQGFERILARARAEGQLGPVEKEALARLYDWRDKVGLPSILWRSLGILGRRER
jgi:hypothetical protein